MRRILVGCMLAGCLAAACQKPGYVKASELQRRGQGPQECASRCGELGMAMGAIVLVGNTLPGCVCVPPAYGLPMQPPPPPAAQGASGVAAGHVVIAAAAAAQEQQRQQQAQQAQQAQPQPQYHR